jgi:beta-glucoside operon transcriptional antiterminator
MKIYKVISNNMVSTIDKNNKEVMIKGNGIGYKKKAGDTVDEDRIEKKFILADEALTRRINEIIISIDNDTLEACVDVVDSIKKSSKIELNDSIYVTLIDHINGLIERMQQGMKFDNSLLWDLKRLYPDEYKLAANAVSLLNEKLPYKFDADEANFITLHIVNAEQWNDMHATYKMTTLINDICDIVSSSLDIQFEENDYYYNRFVMHLKFLLENIRRESIKTEQNDVLDVLIDKYPKAWNVVVKVIDYIYKCTDYKLSDEEQMYIMIHTVQIFRKYVL